MQRLEVEVRTGRFEVLLGVLVLGRLVQDAPVIPLECDMVMQGQHKHRLNECDR
jgi:hypothetical protein